MMTDSELQQRVSDAVSSFWKTREVQARQQKIKGRSDQDARSAVTGGAQMDGFISFFTEIITKSGIGREHIFYQTKLQLPGYFRPTKAWDLLVVRNGQLILVLEAKSQVGPSFGNNFNNRTEEAMGSALDLWTAYREGAFDSEVRPWLGYLFLLEDCPASQMPVSVQEPHFKVFEEFKGASYSKRYEIFCRKLIRERHYDASAFLTSDRARGLKGQYAEPASDLTFVKFAKSLAAHVGMYAKPGI